MTGKPIPNCPAFEFKPYAGLKQLRDDIIGNRLRPYELPIDGAHRAYNHEKSEEYQQVRKAYQWDLTYAQAAT